MECFLTGYHYNLLKGTESAVSLPKDVIAQEEFLFVHADDPEIPP